MKEFYCIGRTIYLEGNKNVLDALLLRIGELSETLKIKGELRSPYDSLQGTLIIECKDTDMFEHVKTVLKSIVTVDTLF